MASALDVAEYLRRQRGPMSAMKLQKLVYYCQAWSLVWDDRPMFGERIEAWANGPVVPSLYNVHRRLFMVDHIPDGNPDVLDAVARETADVVLSFYGDKSAHWLSALTHEEPPWQQARGGLPDGPPCTAEITLASMSEYYASFA